MPFRLSQRHEGVIDHFVGAKRSDQIEKTSVSGENLRCTSPILQQKDKLDDLIPVATSTNPFPPGRGSESFEDLAVGRIPMGTLRERIRGIPALHP